MDYAMSDSDDLTYSDLSPVLIAASSPAAEARARRAVEGAGRRVGQIANIEDAQDSLDRQVSTSALWVEIDCDCGGPLDDLLHRIGRDVAQKRYRAVVSTTGSLVDPIFTLVGCEDIALLVDADDLDRAAALALAAHGADDDRHLNDIAADASGTRLRQLSEEVNRIAATLARISSGAESPARAIHPIHGGAVPEVSAESVRQVIRARRLRDRYFDPELFADPAWDMLLDLLQAELTHVRVPVSSLCIAAAVPATTALRWLKAMVAKGLFLRRADPHDGRRVFVELAPHSSEAMHRYFGALQEIAA